MVVRLKVNYLFECPHLFAWRDVTGQWTADGSPRADYN